MEPEFWLKRWGQRQIGFHKQDINPYLQRYLRRLELPQGSTIFVPLCGKSRDLIWLADHGFSIIGVELSRLAVDAFFSENKLAVETHRQGKFTLLKARSIRLLCGDFFDMTPDLLDGICAVYDRASLIAFPTEQRRDYAQHLDALLPSQIRMLLITLDYPCAEMQGPPFAVDETGVRELYGNRFTVERLESRDVLETEPHFIEKGLTRLSESVYYLERRQ